MKKCVTIVLTAMLAVNVCNSATNDNDVENLRADIRRLIIAQKSIMKDVESIKKDTKFQARQISDIEAMNTAISETIDTVSSHLQELADVQNHDRTSFENDIKETNNHVAANLVMMDTRTMWGAGLLALTIIGFGGYLFVKRRKDSTSMDEVRKAQEALQAAQSKMQEDSVKLDNQMLTLIQQQIAVIPSQSDNNKIDHSLALKVADEIVRIELNLSRMDSSVKGYKQLSKAVERIKNNFLANGYEIIDMLGKPYNEGMKVVANFVPDDTLKEGEQIITGITKPQINYNGQMIQSAQITVSQNI